MESAKSHLTDGLFLRGVCQRGMQLAAGAGERGHHGTDGNGCNRCDLLVGTAFELSKDKDFAKTRRHGFQRAIEVLPTFIGDRDGFGSGNGLQQPGAGISTVKAVEETARAKEGFLSGIFGILAAAQQPSRQVKSSVDMRQHELFEAQAVFGIQIVQRLPSIGEASYLRTGGRTILFSTFGLLQRASKEKNERGRIRNNTGPVTV